MGLVLVVLIGLDIALLMCEELPLILAPSCAGPTDVEGVLGGPEQPRGAVCGSAASSPFIVVLIGVNIALLM